MHLRTVSAAIAMLLCAFWPRSVEAEPHCEWCVEVFNAQEERMEHNFEGGDCEGGGGNNFFEITVCARCGGTSDCHPEPKSGLCHLDCIPQGPDELALINRTVERTLRDLTTHVTNRQPGTAELLAKALASQHSLTYDPESGMIRLKGCGGNVVSEWQVPADVRRSIANSVVA